MDERISTWTVAGGSLALGFGVAVATGVRPVGGIVLLVALAWCARRWARHGIAVTAGLVVAYVAAFVASHGLGRIIGAWPSVAVVSVTVAALSWALADSRAASRS